MIPTPQGQSSRYQPVSLAINHLPLVVGVTKQIVQDANGQRLTLPLGDSSRAEATRGQRSLLKFGIAGGYDMMRIT